MAGDDYIDLFSGDDSVARSRAADLADAIRRRRAAGTLGMITGDPAMSAVGKEMSGDADRMEQGLMGAAQHRAQMDVQRQHYDALAKHQAAMEAQGWGRLDVSRGHLDAINQRLALQGVRYNPNTGQFENIGPKAVPPRKTPPVIPGADAPAAPAPGPSAPAAQNPLPPLGKWQDKALKELGADFDPSGGRAGEFGKNQARFNAATRLLQLAQNPDGSPANLNPQQMPELAQSLASLISNGGQGTMAQIEHLTPKTMSGDWAKVSQWLTNEPQGAGQQAFVQNMIETAKREQAVAQQGIEQVRGQRAQKHQRILQAEPDRSRRLLNSFGWDLSPTGDVVMKGPAAPPQASAEAPPVPGAVKTKSGKWAVKNQQGQWEYVEGK